MKKYLFLLWAAICFTYSNAAPIKKNLAKEKAHSFAIQKGLHFDKELKMVSQDEMKAILGEAQSESPGYYIFNHGNQQGFMIVSGDDLAPEILGYSDTGSIDPENMPDNLKKWLQSYSEQIKYLSAHPSMRIKHKTNDNLEEARVPVGQLCTSEWNQREPYNDRTEWVTGCVPTAMAQLLYYYRKTTVNATLKEIPGYTTSTKKTEIPAIPAGTILDWDNMLDTYPNKGADATEAQRKAVADLMYYCGVCCEADYGYYSGETPAYDGMIASSLMEYFGFDEKAKYVSKDLYTIDEWDRILYNELSHSRPIIYGASNTSGGHEFIIDGFDGESLYHVNWGWGGGGNGYFRLSVMDPNEHHEDDGFASSAGYTSGQVALICAAPQVDDDPIVFENKGVEAMFTASGKTYLTCRYYNRTGETNTFDLGLAYKNTEDELIPFYWRPFEVTLGNNHYNGFSVDLYDRYFKNLPAGTYQIIPIYRYTDNKEEWFECNHQDDEFGMIEWDGTQVTSVSYSSHEPIQSKLTIREVTFNGDDMVGNKQNIDLVVECKEADFKGVLYMFMNTADEISGSPWIACTSIHQGGCQNVRYTFYPKAAGTYNIWIATDNKGTNVIGKYQHIYLENTEMLDLEITDAEIAHVDPSTLNADVKKIYGNDIKVTLKLKNPSNKYPFSQSLWFYFRRSSAIDGYYNVLKYDVQQVIIPPGGTKEVTFMAEDVVGGYYRFDMMSLASNSPTYTHDKLKTYQLNKGVITYKADMSEVASPVPSNGVYAVPSDAVAVDFSASGITSVTPNANANTVYLFGADDVVPASLNGYNVIKSGVADNISIDASKDFYSPINFTAKKMSYSYVPSKYTNGKGGWEAIVLPFDVTAAYADEKEITWFHHSKDYDHDFWVKRYSDQDTESGKVYFDYADQFKAHIPYIVAIPGAHWGPESDLSGKTITFSGENAEYDTSRKLVSSSSVYSFRGTYCTKQIDEDIYYLNAEGNAFTKVSGYTVPPFHAYFAKRYEDDESSSANVSSLIIGSHDDIPTSIVSPFLSEDTQVEIYSINGVKVRDASYRDGMLDVSGLSKGIYIVKGKKMIIQ